MKNQKWVFIGFVCVLILVVLSTVIGIISLFQKDSYLFMTLSGLEVEIYGGGIYQYHTISQVYQVIPHDMVTLFLAMPAYVIGYIAMRKQKLLGNLLFTAITLYLCFTYTIYTFFAIYNQLFLAYVTIMGISFFLIVVLVKSFDYDMLITQINKRYNKKLNTLFLIFVPTLMAMVWLGGILPTGLTGQIPIETQASQSTLVPQAIDLAFLLPLVFYSGIELKKGKKFGFYFSFVIPFFLVFMMGSVLSKGIMLTVTKTEAALELLIFIGLFFVLSIILSIINLRSLKVLDKI